MYHWIVDISNANRKEQLHLTHDKPKCQLGTHRDETDKEAPTEALLYIDQNELMIERVGNTPIMLERGNRNRNLQISHPTRILPQDIIRVGESAFHVDRIHQDYQSTQKVSHFRQMTNKAMIAGAAAMMMAVIPACNPSNSPNNGNDTNTVEVNRLGGAIAIPESDYHSDTPNTDEPVADKDKKGNAAPANADGDANPDIDKTSDSQCENGKRMCLSNNRYECDNHQWKLIEKCPKPALCKEDATSTACTNTEPCKDGEYACFGATIRCEQEPGFMCSRNDEMYQCKDGHWQLVTTCPNDKTCTIQDDKTAKCVDFLYMRGKPKIGDDCRDNQMKCDSGNARMFCHWGRWKYKDICEEDQVCKSISENKVQCVPKSEGEPH